MEEIWKDVPGFEGYYQASTLANIRSLDRMVNTGLNNIKKSKKAGRVLIPSIDKRGRKRYKFCKDGRVFYVNRGTIMGKTFVPNPENKPIIIHLDGDQGNDLPENLMWATHKEKNDKTWGRYEGVAIEIDGKRFNTQASAARYYGIDPALFCSRKQKGWSIEENLKIKPGILKNHGKEYLYEYKGKKYTLRKLAEMNGLTKNALVKRLQNGWGLYEAIETPLVIRNKKKEV